VRRKLVEGAPVLEVLAARQSCVEAALTAKHDPDQRPNCARVDDDVVAEHTRATRRRQEHGGNDLDQCRLAGAVWAEQAVDLAHRDVERDSVERDHARTAFPARFEDARDLLDLYRGPLHGGSV
jgi:hypothetical protein